MPEEYVRFHQDGSRGFCIPELQDHLDFFLRGFEAWLVHQEQTIYAERPKLVVGFRLPPVASASRSPFGERVVLKRFTPRSILHSLVSPIVDPQALRSFRTATRLREAGVLTPPPLIAWASRRPDGSTVDYFITREVSGAMPLRDLVGTSSMAAPPFADRLPRLALLVRGIHDAGVLHRDLTLGNFLVGSSSGDDAIHIIDLSRAVRLTRLPLVLRFMDLARISLDGCWPAFFETYSHGHPNWRRLQALRSGFIWARRSRMALRRAWTPRA